MNNKRKMKKKIKKPKEPEEKKKIRWYSGGVERGDKALQEQAKRNKSEVCAQMMAKMAPSEEKLSLECTRFKSRA
jgi:hypothetical protein